MLWWNFLSNRLDGGTATHTRSGQLRWNFRLSFDEDHRRHLDQFCRQIMQSQPLFDFSAFAARCRALPESVADGGPKWCAVLSPQASKYLARLDEFHEQNPVAAIRIVAVVAAMSSRQYKFGEQARLRVAQWLRRGNGPRQERLALGMLIRKHWPPNDWTLPDGLRRTLLTLLRAESRENPRLVMQILLQEREGFGGATTVFGTNDDPFELIALGRNLKQDLPDFYKATLAGFLSGRGKLMVAGRATEDQIRAVEEELFEFEVNFPSPDVASSVRIYTFLSKWGYPNTPRYQAVLGSLFAAASGMENPSDAARLFHIVAINAPPESSLYDRAMEAFCRWAHSGAEMAALELAGKSGFAWGELLAAAGAVGRVSYTCVRNISLPSNPNHPIVAAATLAYWEFVTRLEHSAAP